MLADSRESYNSALRQAADNSSGVVTFAACLPHESSLEIPGLGNGAFTKAIVEALNGNADLNGNGIRTISEIETYASARVEALTTRAQSTSTFKSSSVPSNMTVGIIVK